MSPQAACQGHFCCSSEVSPSGFTLGLRSFRLGEQFPQEILCPCYSRRPTGRCQVHLLGLPMAGTLMESSGVLLPSLSPHR